MCTPLRLLYHVQSGFLDWYPFDPANQDSAANQEKEVKNGRLAMVSYFPFHADPQYHVQKDMRHTAMEMR